MPVLRHFRHSGLRSSHFTLRLLQLSQPVLTLGENLFFRLLAVDFVESLELELPESAIVVHALTMSEGLTVHHSCSRREQVPGDYVIQLLSKNDHMYLGVLLSRRGYVQQKTILQFQERRCQASFLAVSRTSTAETLQNGTKVSGCNVGLHDGPQRPSQALLLFANEQPGRRSGGPSSPPTATIMLE